MRRGGWAHTEVRFARRKTHGCVLCGGTIDEEPYARTIEPNEVGGLNIWITCSTCDRRARAA